MADLVFAYDNHELIQKLKERGECIVKQDWPKLREKNQEIQELLKDYERLTTPTAAFITFEEEEGRILA